MTTDYDALIKNLEREARTQLRALPAASRPSRQIAIDQAMSRLRRARAQAGLAGNQGFASSDVALNFREAYAAALRLLWVD